MIFNPSFIISPRLHKPQPPVQILKRTDIAETMLAEHFCQLVMEIVVGLREEATVRNKGALRETSQCSIAPQFVIIRDKECQ